MSQPAILITDRPAFSKAVQEILTGKTESVLIRGTADDGKAWNLRKIGKEWVAETRHPIQRSLERAGVQMVLLGSSEAYPCQAMIDPEAWVIRISFRRELTRDVDRVGEWLTKVDSFVVKCLAVHEHDCLPDALVQTLRSRFLMGIRSICALDGSISDRTGYINPHEIEPVIAYSGLDSIEIKRLIRGYGDGNIAAETHRKIVVAMEAAASLCPMSLRPHVTDQTALIRSEVQANKNRFGWVDRGGISRTARFKIRKILDQYGGSWTGQDPVVQFDFDQRNLIARVGIQIVTVSLGDHEMVKNYVALINSEKDWSSIGERLVDLQFAITEFHQTTMEAAIDMGAAMGIICWMDAQKRYSKWPESTRRTIWTWANDLAGKQLHLFASLSPDLRRIGQITLGCQTCEIWRLSAHSEEPTDALLLTAETLLCPEQAAKDQPPTSEEAEPEPTDHNEDQDETDSERGREIRAAQREATTSAPPSSSPSPSSTSSSSASAASSITPPKPAQVPVPKSRSPIEIADALSQEVLGQPEACRSVAFALHAHAMGISRGAMLIHGPTGAGKSHMIEVAARISGGIPVVHVSAPAIVPEGIRGLNISGVLAQLYRASKSDVAKAEKGIIVFDEYDKVVMGHGHDEYCASLNASLLRVIDGCEWNFGSHDDHLAIKSISTKKMMVVLAGAWQQCRTRNSAIGFEVQPHQFINQSLHLIDDLGLAPELAGRISEVAEVHGHTIESLMAILESPAVSPWSIVTSLSGKGVKIDPSATRALAQMAFDKGLGARFLVTACRRLARHLAFTDIPLDRTVEDSDIERIFQ